MLTGSVSSTVKIVLTFVVRMAPLAVVSYDLGLVLNCRDRITSCMSMITGKFIVSLNRLIIFSSVG